MTIKFAYLCLCLFLHSYSMNMDTLKAVIRNEVDIKTLQEIAFLPYKEAQQYIGGKLSARIIYDILAHKNNTSDPYILFCCFQEDIQKKILCYMSLTSTTAQQRFFNNKVSKVFEYYSICQHRNSTLPLDLHFILNYKKQVLFMENIIKNKKEFHKKDIPSLPQILLHEVEYKALIDRRITLITESPWRNSVITRYHITTISEVCEFYQ